MEHAYQVEYDITALAQELPVVPRVPMVELFLDDAGDLTGFLDESDGPERLVLGMDTRPAIPFCQDLFDEFVKLDHVVSLRNTLNRNAMATQVRLPQTRTSPAEKLSH